jgi:hypothetical protein
VRLLVESVKEAPQQIEKEKNRATLRFGEAFQYGDYNAICTLRRVAFQLRNGFLDQLHQANYEHRPADIAQLVDAADSIRHTTVTALHDLKQRLVQSGYGAYRQPGQQSHPACQPLKYAGAYVFSQPMPFFDARVSETDCMPSGRGGHVDEGRAQSTTSATSGDAPAHVHFRDEDIASPSSSSRWRGSILGVLKHSRTRSSDFLLDSKCKSDELAERRAKGPFLSQRPKQNKERTTSSRRAKMEVAEPDP